MNRAVMIEADKARNLRFGTNALCNIEEMTGKSLSNMGEDTSLKDMRIMLYCGLKWEDKQLTIEGTGDVIDAILEKHDMEYLGDKLTKAINLAMPNRKKN